MSRETQAASIKIDDLPQADPLAQKELAAAAGGYASIYTQSTNLLKSPPTVSSLLTSRTMVSLYGSTLGGMERTYMCMW